ncbi:MAG: four helix bundle protein [Phycisphaerae bacterium]
MSAIHSYRDLTVWQKSKQVCKLVYRATEKMPKAEMFGLTSQMRRASVSIPSNIAEGYNRKTTAEYIRGLRIASGSQAELSTQLEIASELGLINPEPDLQAMLQEIDRMLFALIRKLEARQTK